MSGQLGSPGFMDRVRAWARPKLRQRRWQLGGATGLVAVAVLAALGAWTLFGGEDSSKPAITEPPGFSVSPEGDDVPRLAPIKVTFANAPSERTAEKLLKVEPEMDGSYVWLTDRTVLFQPEFPGMLRGSTYTVSVAARPETGLMEDVKKQFTVTGLLTVQQAIPGDADTEVPLNAQVLVQFSRSVAPLTLLSAQSTQPVVAFDPPLEGTGEWLNTSIYRFVPTNLQPFTTYRLKVAKGLSSAADGVLREDFAWSFTTISPAVASVSPDTATEFASLRQQVVVTFNQAMDASAAQAITVKDPAGNAVPGDVAWSEGNTVATFTPSTQLAHVTTYVATIAKGLKGAKGGDTLEDRVSRFTTIGLPAVSSTQPPAGSTNAQRYGVSLAFASPMDAATLEVRLSISGFTAAQLEGTIWADERSVRADISLKPSTAYTVTLAPGAKDRYGQVMGGYSFSFTTGALPSSVTLALPGYSAAATYSASAEPILYYHSTNLSNVRFTLFPLTEAEGQQQLHNYYGGKEKFVPSQPVLREWDEKVSAAKDEVYLGSTSISGGGPLPKGYYYLSTTGEYASEFAFAVVDTVIVTKMSNDELLAWVLDHDTGKALAGVTVKATGPELGSPQATTDASGLASFRIPAPAPGKDFDRSYYLAVGGGGHFGFMSTRWQQGSYPYQLNIPSEYYAREWVGHVYTDRPIYRPGEKVEYKGVSLLAFERSVR